MVLIRKKGSGCPSNLKTWAEVYRTLHAQPSCHVDGFKQRRCHRCA
jgi:hypothetical protein